MAIDASIYQSYRPGEAFGRGFDRGLKIGELVRQRRREKDREDALKSAYTVDDKGQVTVGDLTRLSQVDPQMAMNLQEQDRQRKSEALAGLLFEVKDQPSYERALQAAQQMGIPVDKEPSVYDPNYIRGLQYRALSAKDRLGVESRERELGLRERELGLKERAAKSGMGGLPKPPPGYRYRSDGNLEAIPGGPAAAKEEAEKTKRDTHASTITANAQVLIRDINTARETLQRAPHMAAGFGSWMKGIPYTYANKLKTDLKSIQGTVAIDRLLEIKKSGAGLGHVPQSQLEMLASLMGGLDQDMPPEKLEQNLQDIEDIYADIVRKVGGDPYELAKRRGLGPGTDTSRGGASGGWGEDHADVRRRFKTNEIEWTD